MNLLSWYLVAMTLTSTLDHSGPAKGREAQRRSLTATVKRILHPRTKIRILDVKPLEKSELTKIPLVYQLQNSHPPRIGVRFFLSVDASEMSELLKLREALKTHPSLKDTQQALKVEWHVGEKPNGDHPEVQFTLVVFDRPSP